MKKSEEIKIRIDQLEAEFDMLADKTIGEGISPERHNELWEKFWKDRGWPIREEIRQLEFDMSREKNREIEVGDGVTYHLWSDAYACTVISRTPKRMVIQRDKATLNPNFKPEFVIGGFSAHCLNQEEQSYTYERDPAGEKFTCNWSEKHGCWRSGVDASFRISRGRHEFYDYNF